MKIRAIVGGWLVCFGIWGCSEQSPQSALDDPEPQSVQAATLLAVEPMRFELMGRVQSQLNQPLAFRAAGQVEARLVEIGDFVQAGQVLGRLDNTDLSLQYQGAHAQAQVAAKEARRLADLLTQSQVSLSSYQLAQAQADVAQAQAQLAQRQLSFALLKAPRDGRIAQIDFEPGQSVMAGQSVVLLTSGDWEVSLSIPLSRLENLPSEAQLMGPAGEVCRATQRALASQATDLQTYPALYRLEGCEASSWLGLNRPVVFSSHPKGATHRVPLTAVVNKGQGDFVWRIEQGRLQALPIEVVTGDHQQVWIRTEAPVGAPIVAKGGHWLMDGQPVSVAP